DPPAHGQYERTVPFHQGGEGPEQVAVGLLRVAERGGHLPQMAGHGCRGCVGHEAAFRGAGVLPDHKCPAGRNASKAFLEVAALPKGGNREVRSAREGALRRVTPGGLSPTASRLLTRCDTHPGPRYLPSASEPPPVRRPVAPLAARPGGDTHRPGGRR